MTMSHVTRVLPTRGDLAREYLSPQGQAWCEPPQTVAEALARWMENDQIVILLAGHS